MSARLNVGECMKLLPFMLLVLIAGCATKLGNVFTVDDKAQSMEPYGASRLKLLNPTSETRSGNSYSYRDYILHYSAAIFGADAFDDESFTVTETIQGSNLHVQPAGLGKVTIGHAVAISDQGHFLTVAHVVDSVDSKILFRAYEEGGQTDKLEVLPFRIIFLDDSWDIAVVKVDGMSTPLHLPLRRYGAAVGEDVFTASRRNGGASHGVLTGSVSNDSGSLFRFKSTVPVMQGDSGSPVIDSNGNLIGVISKVGGKRKFEPYSKIVSFDALVLEEIIYTDILPALKNMSLVTKRKVIEALRIKPKGAASKSTDVNPLDSR